MIPAATFSGMNRSAGGGSPTHRSRPGGHAPSQNRHGAMYGADLASGGRGARAGPADNAMESAGAAEARRRRHADGPIGSPGTGGGGAADSGASTGAGRGTARVAPSGGAAVDVAAALAEAGPMALSVPRGTQVRRKGDNGSSKITALDVPPAVAGGESGTKDSPDERGASALAALFGSASSRSNSNRIRSDSAQSVLSNKSDAASAASGASGASDTVTRAANKWKRAVTKMKASGKLSRSSDRLKAIVKLTSEKGLSGPLTPRKRPPSQIKTARQLVVEKRTRAEKKLATKKQIDKLNGVPSQPGDQPPGKPPIPLFTLRPQSPIRLAWDMTVMLNLLYIAVVVPYRIGFEEDAKDGWHVLERLIDFFFITDLLVNFRTGYVSGTGQEVYDWKMIAKNYLSGWFWIDFVSSIPFDLIFEGDDGAGGGGQSVKILKAGRVVKAIRVLRLAKLVRFLKLSAVIEKLEENFSLNRNVLHLAKLLLGTLMMCHFFACSWFFVGSFTNAYDPNSWIYDQNLWDSPTSEKYLASFYWSVATLATVGYGDVVPIAPSERWFAVFGMLLGGGYFGYIIALMASLVSKLDASSARYYEKMDSIAAYMKSRNLPRDLQTRVRRYYKHYLEQKTAFDEATILSELSSFLREEVAMFLINDTIYAIPIFSNRGPHFVATLIRVLKPLTCAPGDYIMEAGDIGRDMFVLIRGELEVLAQDGTYLATLAAGAYFGELAALGENSVRMTSVRATTFCELYSLSREDLFDGFSEYPELLDDMRREAMATYDDLKRKYSEVNVHNVGQYVGDVPLAEVDGDAEGGALESEGASGTQSSTRESPPPGSSRLHRVVSRRSSGGASKGPGASRGDVTLGVGGPGSALIVHHDSTPSRMVHGRNAGNTRLGAAAVAGVVATHDSGDSAPASGGEHETPGKRERSSSTGASPASYGAVSGLQRPPMRFSIIGKKGQGLMEQLQSERSLVTSDSGDDDGRSSDSKNGPGQTSPGATRSRAISRIASEDSSPSASPHRQGVPRTQSGATLSTQGSETMIASSTVTRSNEAVAHQLPGAIARATAAEQHSPTSRDSATVATRDSTRGTRPSAGAGSGSGAEGAIRGAGARGMRGGSLDPLPGVARAAPDVPLSFQLGLPNRGGPDAAAGGGPDAGAGGSPLMGAHVGGGYDGYGPVSGPPQRFSFSGPDGERHGGGGAASGGGAAAAAGSGAGDDDEIDLLGNLAARKHSNVSAVSALSGVSGVSTGSSGTADTERRSRSGKDSLPSLSVYDPTSRSASLTSAAGLAEAVSAGARERRLSGVAGRQVVEAVDAPSSRRRKKDVSRSHGSHAYSFKHDHGVYVREDVPGISALGAPVMLVGFQHASFLVRTTLTRLEMLVDVAMSDASAGAGVGAGAPAHGSADALLLAGMVGGKRRGAKAPRAGAAAGAGAASAIEEEESGGDGEGAGDGGGAGELAGADLKEIDDTLAAAESMLDSGAAASAGPPGMQISLPSGAAGSPKARNRSPKNAGGKPRSRLRRSLTEGADLTAHQQTAPAAAGAGGATGGVADEALRAQLFQMYDTLQARTKQLGEVLKRM